MKSTKIKEHINISKSIITCIKCKKLMLPKYFENNVCEKCKNNDNKV